MRVSVANGAGLPDDPLANNDEPKPRVILRDWRYLSTSMRSTWICDPLQSGTLLSSVP